MSRRREGVVARHIRGEPTNLWILPVIGVIDAECWEGMRTYDMLERRRRRRPNSIFE